MATLQALSSSRVKNRGLNYDEIIIRKIREDFIKYVDPKILLLHLHILSTEDEERIDARQNSEGKTSAARLLLQLLSHYPEWIPKLLESLLHPDVLLEHLADKIKQSLEEVMMVIDIDEDNTMEVDPDSPPSPAAIGQLSSFLVPEGSGLHAQKWTEEQLNQYIISVRQQMARGFFTIFFSTVNQITVDTFREREHLDMIVTSFAIGCLEILLRMKSPQDVQKLRELHQTGALCQALEGSILTGERQQWLVQEAKKYGLKWRRLTLKITISEEHLQRCEQYLASKHDTKINKTSTVLTIEYGKERLQIVEMIKNLGDVAGNDAEKIISDSIQKLENADKKMADEYVDKTVDEMQERVLNGIESIRAFLKRIVPREPLPEDFESELQYQAAYVAYEAKLLAFKTLLKMTKSGLDKFSETLAGVLKKVSEFLSELWQWVKEKGKDIYEKVCLFVQSIKDGFNACTTESESIITTGESSV